MLTWLALLLPSDNCRSRLTVAQVRSAMYPGYPAARGPVHQPALAPRPGAAQPFYPGARAAPPPTVIRCRFSSEDICTFILILQRAKVSKFGRAIFLSQGTQNTITSFLESALKYFRLFILRPSILVFSEYGCNTSRGKEEKTQSLKISAISTPIFTTKAQCFRIFPGLGAFLQNTVKFSQTNC